MKTKTQKGITLIALIITIIVMLILVGVSVSVALNTGLFKAAQGAAKNTEAAKENETKLSSGIVTIYDEEGNPVEKTINEIVYGAEDKSTGPAVGDYVSYLGSGAWRIVQINNEQYVLYGRISQVTDQTTLLASYTNSGTTTKDDYLATFVDSNFAESAIVGNASTYVNMLTGKVLPISDWEGNYGTINGEQVTGDELTTLGLTQGTFFATGSVSFSSSSVIADIFEVDITGNLGGLKNVISSMEANCDAFISVTLKEGVSLTGEGNESSPYTLSNS